MTKKIVIADDELSASIMPILDEEGYKVSVANGAKEFIDLLKNVEYDLGLIDFFMPEMSGRELAENIRKEKIKDLKLVFTNVMHFGAKGKEELRRLGVFAYIYGIGNGDFKKFIKEIV